MKIKKLIVPLLAIVIIIAGIVMIGLKGFNYSLLYSKTQRMNIYINKEFEIEDIKAITDEVLSGKTVEVQKVDQFETIASIVTTEITDEEKDNIITKLNEKYEIDIDKDTDILLVNIPQIKIWDVVEKYIAPLIVITVASLAYMAVRFKKQGVVKSLVIPFVSVVLTMGLYVSIVALARIPVNELFVVFAVLIYILTFIGNAIKLNKAEE